VLDSLKAAGLQPLSDFDFRRLRPGIDGAIPSNTRVRRAQK
jgi:hypothetical protein